MTKWQLVQAAEAAKAAGLLDEHARLVGEIAALNARCLHESVTYAACERGTETEFGECDPGDVLQVCVDCGSVIARIPSDRPSGVRCRE